MFGFKQSGSSSSGDSGVSSGGGTAARPVFNDATPSRVDSLGACRRRLDLS